MAWWFLTATTAKPSGVIDLLHLAVSRIRSIDRAAFGFGPTRETTTSRTPGAPPECVEAWRGGQVAPVHCEDYPEAHRATLEQSEGVTRPRR